MNETLIQKIQSAQRCLKRAREVYRACKENFAENYDAQDIVALNLIRLCETTDINTACEYLAKHGKIAYQRVASCCEYNSQMSEVNVHTIDAFIIL